MTILTLRKAFVSRAGQSPALRLLVHAGGIPVQVSGL
jgi:hypothetical protein